MPLTNIYSKRTPEDEDATSASNETAFVSDGTYKEDLLFAINKSLQPIIQLKEIPSKKAQHPQKII